MLSNKERMATATALSALVFGAATATAYADEALADLAEKVSPSVVTVLAQQDIDTSNSAFSPNEGFRVPEGSPFGDFFKRFGPEESFPEQFRDRQARQGLGSGFIFDPDGWLVTNHHVVDGSSDVTVRLNDGREFEAEVVGVDEQTDIALLRIQADQALPYVTLGDSESIRVGEDVMAVGNPFGLGGTVTQGIVSAKDRNISGGPYAEFIQTDAAINKGNSGGPLFNMDGEVVGVNSAIYSPSGGSVGVGFAVTSNIVETIVSDLKEDGEVDRGWLGVSIQDISEDLASALGLEEPKGALVSSVVAGSPSEGNLRAGDVILEFDGQDVADSRALPKLVAATAQGTNAELVLFRDGQATSVEIQIGELRSAEAAATSSPSSEHPASLENFGATVAELDETARKQTGVGDNVEGVVVTSLSSEGPAIDAGLRVGDVIVKIGDQEVRDTDALRNALAEERTQPSLILINRAGQQIFLAAETA